MNTDVDTIENVKVGQSPPPTATTKIMLEFDSNTGELINLLNEHGKLVKDMRCTDNPWPMHDTIIGIQKPHMHGPQPRSCCPGGKRHWSVNGENVCY